MYQYDRSNRQIAAQLTCSFATGRTDIGGAWRESSRRKMIAATRPTAVIPAPSHKGGCQPPSYKERAQVGEVSREKDPTRARLRNSAMASAIPLRKNQRATPAMSEMNIAPSLMPNTRRQAHMSP